MPTYCFSSLPFCFLPFRYTNFVVEGWSCKSTLFFYKQIKKSTLCCKDSCSWPDGFHDPCNCMGVQSVLSSTSERQMKELRFRFSLKIWNYHTKFQNQEIDLGSHGNFKRRVVAFYLLFGHTYSMGSNQLFLLSWNYSDRTFCCCCRNSYHYTHLPHLSLKTPVFGRNLALTARFQILSNSGNQAPESPGWALCMKAILEPSLSHPSGCEQLSQAAALTESGHLRQKGAFAPDPHSMLAIIVLLLNWFHLPQKSTACKRSCKNHCVVLRI